MQFTITKRHFVSFSVVILDDFMWQRLHIDFVQLGIQIIRRLNAFSHKRNHRPYIYTFYDWYRSCVRASKIAYGHYRKRRLKYQDCHLAQNSITFSLPSFWRKNLKISNQWWLSYTLFIPRICRRKLSLFNLL